MWWLVALTDAPQGLRVWVVYRLGLNPGEGMAVCKCTTPLRHVDTLNSRRAACPFVRLGKGEERWEASDHPQGLTKLGWNLAK
ncbi:hypothetical protein TNCV_4695931 [Trichonephila clavipes]|nr:hypothetical protein TNCV_4695931 [Trichonephila clavipes]